MGSRIMPRNLHDLSDADLLDLAFEPEFMARCTPLEVELLWRLVSAINAVELERASMKAIAKAFWSESR